MTNTEMCLFVLLFIFLRLTTQLSIKLSLWVQVQIPSLKCQRMLTPKPRIFFLSKECQVYHLLYGTILVGIAIVYTMSHAKKVLLIWLSIQYPYFGWVHLHLSGQQKIILSY